MDVRRLLILLFLLLAAGCSPGAGKTETPTSTHTPEPRLSIGTATATATQYFHPSSTPTPAYTPLPPTPTPTVQPVYLNALVFASDPQVPVLTYHQFAPDTAPTSHALKVRLSDFRDQLQKLYDSGYSLVSLEDWISGKLETPVGKRPLILSMDDLFYNNQITLLEDGSPDPETGIGVLWQFYQEHPDFGFKLALFASLGDKLYANPDDPGWQDSLARAIAWCIDHQAMVYNHFYTHPRLDLTQPKDITWEAQMNDLYLRKLLKRISREDLIPKLQNIFALPFGVWPEKRSAQNALLEYTGPEGKALQGVMEIDYIIRPKFLLPPFMPGFDRWHLPRIVSTQSAIDYLVDHRDQFPRAEECALGPVDETMLGAAGYIEGQVSLAQGQEKCPQGIYIISGKTYRTQDSKVKEVYP